MITKDTATDIALAYREIDVSEKLLAEITDTLARRDTPDIRDAFGRPTGGLQLGVPYGSNDSRRMFDVPWNLAKPIIEAHIASKKALLSALTEKARIEIDAA